MLLKSGAHFWAQQTQQLQETRLQYQSEPNLALVGKLIVSSTISFSPINVLSSQNKTTDELGFTARLGKLSHKSKCVAS